MMSILLPTNFNCAMLRGFTPSRMWGLGSTTRSSSPLALMVIRGHHSISFSVLVSNWVFNHVIMKLLASLLLNTSRPQRMMSFFRGVTLCMRLNALLASILMLLFLMLGTGAACCPWSLSLALGLRWRLSMCPFIMLGVSKVFLIGYISPLSPKLSNRFF
jgi:hypothetical protein